MPISDYPDFTATNFNVSNNGTDPISSQQKPKGEAKIGERVAEKKQPASPRTERVRTFITKVAELAMWALVAIPGVSQLRYLYAHCCRGKMENKEVNCVETQPTAPETPGNVPKLKTEETVLAERQVTEPEMGFNVPKCNIEQKTKISAQAMLISLHKLSHDSFKSACFAQDPMDRLQHLADFCERRRQIAAAGLEYQELDFENNKDLKEFVAIPKVQSFLENNIVLLQKLRDSGKFENQVSFSLQYMLAVIADLKGLPNSDANALARFPSEIPIRF